ncbi:MAG: ABC transporter ATP-binding protein [Candidatus Xenobia bacterium]
MILLSEVSRSYREAGRLRPVLKAASLSVQAGQFVVLLGKSGSGKSTLLNLVSGIDLPDAGRIEVLGTRLGELDDRSRTLWRRRHVGFVFQFFNLIPTLTVEENVALPLELNHSRGFEAVGELLARVGLADRAHSFPERLSGGEQQRVALARALAHDPELILADEPTGNLDDETGESVLGLLGELLRERGKTLLVATHSQELLRLADRVFDLHDGQLVERAS